MRLATICELDLSSLPDPFAVKGGPQPMTKDEFVALVAKTPLKPDNILHNAPEHKAFVWWQGELFVDRGYHEQIIADMKRNGHQGYGACKSYREMPLESDRARTRGNADPGIVMGRISNDFNIRDLPGKIAKEVVTIYGDPNPANLVECLSQLVQKGEISRGAFFAHRLKGSQVADIIGGDPDETPVQKEPETPEEPESPELQKLTDAYRAAMISVHTGFDAQGRRVDKRGQRALADSLYTKIRELRGETVLPADAPAIEQPPRRMSAARGALADVGLRPGYWRGTSEALDRALSHVLSGYGTTSDQTS